MTTTTAKSEYTVSERFTSKKCWFPRLRPDGSEELVGPVYRNKREIRLTHNERQTTTSFFVYNHGKVLRYRDGRRREGSAVPEHCASEIARMLQITTTEALEMLVL